jgi:2,3-bisphosphoglycerate-independent phosphoglycerate mutase
MTNHHSNQENQPSNNSISAKKVVLCILDGWGIADNNSPNNAIAMANLKFYPQLINNYPNSRIGTSGLAVGLPEGQIGNSEVGHITIGAGRVIFQDLPRINLAIQDNSLANNHLIQQLIKDFYRNLEFPITTWPRLRKEQTERLKE